MATRSERRGGGGVIDLATRPAARAGFVLIVLWMGSAVVLRGSSDFGPMIAILACASVVLGATAGGYRYFLFQLVLWGALLVATGYLLWSSVNLLPMLVLFGVAGAWFVVAEPLIRARGGGTAEEP